MATVTKLTYDDYVAMPDDGRRHEIVDGDDSVLPWPSTPHQRVSLNLILALAPYVEKHGGDLLYAPLDVILSPENVVQPDVVYVRPERAAIVEKPGIFGAPDLAVEILSESNRLHDVRRKKKLYERFGVREYWMVDPDRKTVTVLRLEGAAYVRAAELTAGVDESFSSPLFPGLTIALAAMFR
jgi:Uma2 family endonuclease